MSHLVRDPLAAGLRRGPEFKVGEPIVQAVPVAVMDVLVASEGPAKMPSHDEAVLGRVRGTARQVLFLLGDGDVAIPL